MIMWCHNSHLKNSNLTPTKMRSFTPRRRFWRSYWYQQHHFRSACRPRSLELTRSFTPYLFVIMLAEGLVSRKLFCTVEYIFAIILVSNATSRTPFCLQPKPSIFSRSYWYHQSYLEAVLSVYCMVSFTEYLLAYFNSTFSHDLMI